MPNSIIDCSKIPKKIYHGKECYDWLNSQNVRIPFQYNDLIGTLEIVSVEKKGHGYNLTVNYEGKLSQIESSSLISGQLGNCIGVFTSEFKYAPGQRICDGKRDITILDVYRGTLTCSPYKHKMLTYQCNKCGYINKRVREGTIVRGAGCPVCNGKIIKKGFNDIPSKEPWMIPYFPGGVKEAELYTPSSGRQIQLICPYCGKLSDHSMAIATLCRTHSIGCPCGDGISFPEKFLFNFFQAINVVEYTRQVSAKDFTWCGKYRYDGMFKKDGDVYFVEVHGLQHFEHTGYERITSVDLEATKENDRQKRLLAIENGILEKNYIVLDCRKSTLMHLKRAILTSPLVEILGLDDIEIDWEAIFIKSLAPLQKEILDYAQSHPHTSTKDIARLYGVHPSYPARILTAYGMYGKVEREERRSKVFFENNRRQLFFQIKQMIAADPEVTISKIASRLGRNKSGIYAMLRKYKYEHSIDLESLNRNAEGVRLRQAKESVCKPVHIIAPNGEEYDFSSLTEACKELEKIYRIPLPMSSVSISISQDRSFKGFLFRYINSTN